MWLFVFVWPESECCEPGLQCGREGHLAMKIRYPMECFNGKKMSLLWAGESVIMQEEECDYGSNVFVRRMPPRLCTSVCARAARVAVCSFMHEVCKCAFLAGESACCISSQGHLFTQSLRTDLHPVLNMQISWWCCSAVGGGRMAATAMPSPHLT